MPHSDFDFLPIYAHARVSQIIRDSLPLKRQHLEDDLRRAASANGVAYSEATAEKAHAYLLRRCDSYRKTNTPPMAVYVPISEEATFIAKGSAIVAKEEPDATGRVVVYFEGNLYCAENLKRYEERLLCAAGRAASRYPTAAIASFHVGQLRRIGTYDYATQRLDLTDSVALDAWLATESAPTSA
jgi:hypothetical protein